MRNYEDALNLLLVVSRDIAKMDRTRKDYLSGGLSPADKAEKIERLDQQLVQQQAERLDILRDLVRYPPYHLQYLQRLEQFDALLKGQGKPYERRVFVMTKYTDGKDAQRDKELQAVLDAVRAAVQARGYHAQFASDLKLHENLWENIECQMLGCARGIAVVEDRFNPKLNPNVAMEWGWMRAMKKPVLYLVEKKVEQIPADVAGLIKSRFDWDDPQASITKLVADELPP